MKYKLIITILSIAMVLTNPLLNNANAAGTEGYFWCHAYHNDGNEARNFYSKVFKGTLEYKINYENAFRARIAARILQKNLKGSSSCFYNKAKGEAWRELDEYALSRKLAGEGTIEFIDWVY